MTKNELYSRIDDLEYNLSQERTWVVEAKHQLAQVQDAKIRLADDMVKIQADYAKKIKDVDRLEKINKKQMLTIDALKKAAANQEVLQDRYAREKALQYALSLGLVGDEHIFRHAKKNYEFITNTIPAEVVPANPTDTGDLKFTHIDEV